MFDSHSTTIHVFVGTKIVGKVENQTFFKSIRGSKHLLRTPPAIAFDVASLDQAEKAGAVSVEIRDTENDTRYLAPIALIRERGFSFNRGFGEQIALTLNHWETRRKGESYQLPLFGGAA